MSNTILIVDDAPANLELLTGLLRRRGYRPRPVPNGDLVRLMTEEIKVRTGLVKPEMFIDKPFDPEELIEKVRDIIGT